MEKIIELMNEPGETESVQDIIDCAWPNASYSERFNLLAISMGQTVQKIALIPVKPLLSDKTRQSLADKRLGVLRKKLFELSAKR